MTRLRTRLAFSHIVLAVGALLLAGVLSTFALRGRFDQYVAASIDARIDTLAKTMVSARYPDGTWNLAIVERQGITALEDGFLLTLAAGDGSILWDARTHNAGLCAAMVSSMADRMAGLGRDDSGSYSERILGLGTLPAGHGLHELDPADGANLTVGYWGPIYYRDADIEFIADFNRALLAAGALVVVVAALAGIAGAAALATPVRSAAAVARAVAAGDYSPRVKVSGIVELDELGSSLGDMAKTLEEQEDLRKRLVIDASHEIRTPLAALRARLEAVVDGVLQVDATLVDACLADVSRLTGLARSLEGLATVESAACNPDCIPLDIAQLAIEVMENHILQAAKAGLVFELSCPVSVIVKADRTLVLQIIENLVSNAVRYGVPVSHPCASSVPTKATIRIELGVEGSVAVLSVTDFGSGMEALHLERIFERFYRIDTSRSRGTGGFGVGLAIARTAARACGGEIMAFSAGTGSGSRFELRLPAVLHREAISG